MPSLHVHMVLSTSIPPCHHTSRCFLGKCSTTGSLEAPSALLDVAHRDANVSGPICCLPFPRSEHCPHIPKAIASCNTFPLRPEKIIEVTGHHSKPKVHRSLPPPALPSRSALALPDRAGASLPADYPACARQLPILDRCGPGGGILQFDRYPRRCCRCACKRLLRS